MNKEFQNELDWTAFCYAAGELTPAETERFELRLAEEQPAREALARAIEITQAVTVAESQPCGLVTVAGRSQTNWVARLSWMAIGGLAALVVAMVWSGAFSPGTVTTAARPAIDRQRAEQQRSLAAAWSEARQEIASAREDGSWPTIAPSPSELDDEASAVRTAPSDDLALEETPNWMTTAVLGLAGMSPDESESGEGPFNNE